MGPLVSGLGSPRKAYRRRCAAEPIQLSAFPLVFGGRSIYGALAGTAIETEDALAFSVLENIRPMIETVPLERAAEGLRSHDARQSTVPHGASDEGRGCSRRTGQLRQLEAVLQRILPKEMSMSTKIKRNRSTEFQATSTRAETEEDAVGNSARDEEIRRRAYEIYL